MKTNKIKKEDSEREDVGSGTQLSPSLIPNLLTQNSQGEQQKKDLFN